MRFPKSLGVAVAAVLMAPLTWVVSTPAGAATDDTLRLLAQQYEARLNAAWVGQTPPAMLDTVTNAGVTRVRALLTTIQAAGLAVRVASSRIADVTYGGPPMAPTMRALVIHSFTYQTPDDATDSTEAIWTTYQFAESTSSAELATVTEMADGNPDTPVVPAADDSLVPSGAVTAVADGIVSGSLLRSYADPSGGDCSQTDPTYCVSRSAAAGYAAAYACSSCHDSTWHYFSGDDCTNFISVALLTGGWPAHGYRKDDYSWWYSTSSYYTYTWTVANHLYNYMRNSHWADAAANVSSLRVGDVLQTDWYSDRSINHTMMVTKKDSSGLYLSYHSNDTLNKPFSKISADNPGTTWYGWLLHSTVRNDW